MAKKSILPTILASLIIIMICVAIPGKAQMCQFTGNVDYSATPTEGTTNRITYTFKNHNSYSVTVKAFFTIVSADGVKKTPSRTFVMAPGATHEEKFTCNLFSPAKNISASDSEVNISVSKCD